jgi:hypothetical protein
MRCTAAGHGTGCRGGVPGGGASRRFRIMHRWRWSPRNDRVIDIVYREVWDMNKYRAWLHRVTFVGVLINILGWHCVHFAPQWYLDFFELPAAARSSGCARPACCVVHRSPYPGGRDPVRYRLNAYFAVGVRDDRTVLLFLCRRESDPRLPAVRVSTAGMPCSTASSCGWVIKHEK